MDGHNWRDSQEFAVWLNSYNRVHHADLTPGFAPDYLLNEFLADKENGAAQVEDRQRNEVERLRAEMEETQRNLRDAYGMTTALNREIEMLNRVRVTQAARIDELARLLTEGRDLVNEYSAENAKLSEQLAAAITALQAMTNEMETVVYSGFDPDRWGERMDAIGAAGKVLKEWNTPKPC